MNNDRASGTLGQGKADLWATLSRIAASKGWDMPVPGAPEPPRPSAPACYPRSKPKARRRAKIERQRATDERRRREIEAQWNSDRYPRELLEWIPAWLWRLCFAIMADTTGRCARIALAHCRHKTFAALVRIVARVRLDDGSYRYKWGHRRAREACAAAMLIWYSAKRTKRPDRWKYCCRGVTRKAICRAIQDPATAETRSAGFLTHSYHTGGRWNKTRKGNAGVGCGIIEALEQVGALYQVQRKAEGMRTGNYPASQYFIITDQPEDDDTEPSYTWRDRLWELHTWALLVESHGDDEPVCAIAVPLARPP